MHVTINQMFVNIFALYYIINYSFPTVLSAVSGLKQATSRITEGTSMSLLIGRMPKIT